MKDSASPKHQDCVDTKWGQKDHFGKGPKKLQSNALPLSYKCNGSTQRESNA